MSQIVKDMKNQIKLRSDIPSFLKSHCIYKKACEVGTRFGYNLEQIFAMNPDLLVAIDHYQNTGKPEEQDTELDQKKLNGIYNEVFMRFLNEPAVKIYRGKSNEIVHSFPKKFFDYVYIDADHSYAGALADIGVWWSRVRQGGILAGHDYVDAKSKNGVDFGVIKAVHDFMEKMKIKKDNLHFTTEGYRTWMIFNEDGE